MQRLPLAVVLLLLAPLAFAQVYKWTDTSGTVHYSESPPANGKYQQIKTSGSAQPFTPPAASAVNTADKASAAAAPVASANTVADTPENRSKLCTSLTANLAALRGGTPVVMQEDGKNVALDDGQRKTQIDSAQSQYAQYCQSY